MDTGKSRLTGRAGELMTLEASLADAMEGHGQSVNVLGEPGIGKSRLVEEFVSLSKAKDVRVLAGRADEGGVQPFGVFSKTLSGIIGGQLFQEEEFTGFYSIFLISESGMLMAKSSSDAEDTDADIFAGMLTAVQSFVKDSFDTSGSQTSGLGKLVYGDMAILMEHGKGFFLTCVVKGKEHPEMRTTLGRATKKIEDLYGGIISGWSGNVRDLVKVQEEINQLAQIKFLVKKDMEGVKFEDERLRIAEHAMSQISIAATKAPLLILLEDIHWADDSSLFLFSYLARNIGNDKVFLLATSRQDGNPGFGKFHEALLEEQTTAELELGGLDENGVRYLVNEMFSPNDFPDDFSTRLAEDSKGNPLFIKETLRNLMDESGILMERGSYYLAIEDYQLPKTVEEIVKRRLDALEPECMAVAEYASCIGLEFTHHDLMSLVSLGDPKDAIEKLGKTGVMVVSNRGARFSHATFRQVTYDGISKRWKSVYHKSLGEYYEREHASDPGEYIYELARHFASCGENKKAFDYCIKAGERAENSYAVEVARQFYSTALELLPKVKQPIEKKVDILEKLADSEKALGLIPESLEKYQEVLTLLDNSDSGYINILMKMGSAHTVLNDHENAYLQLEKAMPLVPNAPNELACQVLARFGLMKARRGDRDEAGELAEQVLSRIGDIKDITVKVGTYTTLGQLYDTIGLEEAATRMHQTGVDQAEQSGNMKSLAIAYSDMGMYMHFRGEDLAATRLLEKSVSYRERLGDISTLSHTLVTLGMTYSDCGELDKSLASLKRSLVLSRKIGAKLSLASVLGNIGYTLAMMGRNEESLQYQEESLDIRRKHNNFGGMAWSYLDMSMVHFQMGNIDRTAECLESASTYFNEADDEVGLTNAKIAAADLYKSIGETERAIKNYKEGLEMARTRKLAIMQFQAQVGLAEMGAVEPDSVLPDLMEITERLNSLPLKMSLQRFLGNLAFDQSDHEGAERHYYAALELGAGTSNMETDIARADILTSRARLQLEMGKKREALEQASEAERLFRKWGRLREATQADELSRTT